MYMTTIPPITPMRFTMLAAIQAFFAGLILSSIVQKNRQDFELALHQASDTYKGLMMKENTNG